MTCRRSIAPLGAITAVVGVLLASAAAALAAGNSIKLSAPSSVKYGSSITFTVSGHGSRPKHGLRRQFPPNLVIVDGVTSASARCPSKLGGPANHLESLLRFHTKKVSQLLKQFSRTQTVMPPHQAYGLCAYLLNFPAGGLYAHAAVYWTVTGAPVPHTLNVSIVPNSLGEGSVVSSSDYDETIDCDPWRSLNICSHTYSPGTTVTLSPKEPDQFAFAGWSGACTGTNLTCQVTMDSDKSVTATFTGS